MRLASLGSGSKGNATLIESGDTCLLVDLGFNLKETIARLQRLDRSPLDITAVLVTHEHSDHIGGVGAFARKFKTPVYMSFGTSQSDRAGTVPQLHAINCHQPFTIGDLQVHPVPVPHDAREPCQFVFSDGQHRVGVLTDLGHITPHVIAEYQHCHALLLECNHDPQMLRDGPYPWPLKQRVGGELGHLSNLQAAQLLTSIELAQLQHLVISHISEQNNTPDQALGELREVLSDYRGNLLVASQQQGFGWMEVSDTIA